MEATAPEWPRANAMRSSFASCASPSRSRRCATARSSKGITVAIQAEDTPGAVNFLQPASGVVRTKAKRRHLSVPPPYFRKQGFLLKRRRNRVELRREVGADARQSANARNGDQSGDQA